MVNIDLSRNITNVKVRDNSGVFQFGDGSTVTGNNSSSSMPNATPFPYGQAELEYFFHALRSRWDVVRFIVMRNIKLFCQARFDESDKEHMKLWQTSMDLPTHHQENHEPCLDYLNLISFNNTEAIEVHRPTVLRNSANMCMVWVAHGGNSHQIKAYLQRRLLTYYHCVYKKIIARNEDRLKFDPESIVDDVPPYLSFPGEIALRKRYQLQSLQDIFAKCFEETGYPFEISDLQVQMNVDANIIGLDNINFGVRYNKEAATYNTTKLYQEKTEASLKDVMYQQSDWRKSEMRFRIMSMAWKQSVSSLCWKNLLSIKLYD